MTEEERICRMFANKHKIDFIPKGTVGFGRDCVGFSINGNYINYNPIAPERNYDFIPEFFIKEMDLIKPEDSYHKHDCLAVLVHNEDYKAAIRQLSAWVVKMEALGEVEIREYKTGYTGMQAMFSGATSKVVVIKRGMK